MPETTTTEPTKIEFILQPYKFEYTRKATLHIFEFTWLH